MTRSRRFRGFALLLGLAVTSCNAPPPGSDGDGGTGQDGGNDRGAGGGSGGGGGAGGASGDAGGDVASGPCSNGMTRACYGGPVGTEGVGLCKAGSQTCSGGAWGPCDGQVLPAAEDCKTVADEDCNGRGSCVVIDLRADNNRNGTVDLADPTEDAFEDRWDASHGAIVLPNIDDDTGRCPKKGYDDDMAACHDGADEVVNGADDALDLARLEVVPFAMAAADAKGTLKVAPALAAQQLRFFRDAGGGTWKLFDPAKDAFDGVDLKNGVHLAVEAKDVLRDASAWDGYADVTLTVDSGTGPAGLPWEDGTDTVRLRVAPLVFQHHGQRAETVFATKSTSPFGSTGVAPFLSSLGTAVTTAGVPNPIKQFESDDPWTQDLFETATLSLPAAGGKAHTIRVYVRSANYGKRDPGLRPAGRVIFTQLRGKDVGGVQAYDPMHDDALDTLNSLGNLETIPPFTLGGEAFPLGRVLRGSTPTHYPDKVFDKMVVAQGVQPWVLIDTSWLDVGHVDETISFLPDSSPRGWCMLVNDPALARKMLEDAKAAGNGAVKMFEGLAWADHKGATRTIADVLADATLMSTSAMASAEIAVQVETIKKATGITDAEIVRVPFLHRANLEGASAYQPGTVNMLVFSDKTVAPPVPHGPVIGGKDIFKVDLEKSLGDKGYTVAWVEDWDLFHVRDGEVHCATNAARDISSSPPWWTSGR